MRVAPIKMKCGRAHSPPRRGGVAAAVIKRGEATEAPQTGWSVRRDVQASRFRRTDHPVRAFSEREYFFDGAASLEASPYRARASRPPLQGGECAPYFTYLDVH